MTAIKQKVKYTVAYDSTNDTLSEKLNVLLGNIITLIRTNNDDLLELTRITYGSEQMTGAPLLENTVNVDSTRKFESDVVFLGTSKNNLVLSLCFYNGRLVIAMNADPYVESLYMSIWNNIKPTSAINSCITAKACRWTNTGNEYNRYNINIPYIINNNIIELSVVYWTGNYSSGYMFYNGNRATNGVDLVIYKTVEDDSNTAGLGGALYMYSNATNSYHNFGQSQLLSWSFEENLTNNMIKDHMLCFRTTSQSDPYYNASTTPYYDSDYTVQSNAKHDLREWFYTTNTWGGSSTFSYHFYQGTKMADMHTLGNLDGKCSDTSTVMPNFDTVEASGSDSLHISALCSAYNLPYLEGDTQAYFRRMHVPGFNKYCKGEIYLMWTPSLTSYKSGDIVSCDGKKFAVINQGVVCWVARVE